MVTGGKEISHPGLKKETHSKELGRNIMKNRQVTASHNRYGMSPISWSISRDRLVVIQFD